MRAKLTTTVGSTRKALPSAYSTNHLEKFGARTLNDAGAVRLRSGSEAEKDKAEELGKRSGRFMAVAMLVSAARKG
jgi:hypothetical protein